MRPLDKMCPDASLVSLRRWRCEREMGRYPSGNSVFNPSLALGETGDDVDL